VTHIQNKLIFQVIQLPLLLIGEAELLLRLLRLALSSLGQLQGPGQIQCVAQGTDNCSFNKQRQGAAEKGQNQRRWPHDTTDGEAIQHEQRQYRTAETDDQSSWLKHPGGQGDRDDEDTAIVRWQKDSLLAHP
jgi:hypothetical protein